MHPSFDEIHSQSVDSNENHTFGLRNPQIQILICGFRIEIRRFLSQNPWISLQSADFNEIHSNLSRLEQGNIE